MKYAIVESGGKQYKAVEGGVIEIDRLPVAPGSSVKLERVLLMADGEQVTVGKPIIRDNPVWTKVIEHFKGPKVVIFNYRPKKRIRVKTGHRQNYTRLLVEQVGGSTLVPRREPEKVPASEAEGTAQDKLTEKRKGEAREEKAPRAAKPRAEAKPAKKEAASTQKAGKPEKKSAPPASKTKAAPAKTTAKKPAAKKPAAKKPSGKSSAK